MDRIKNLERVQDRSEPWDIIIIGGGATGAGCALDAASRGFDVLLLEQHDFGKGTSSRSTKLIHGGIRYLAQGDVPMVRESLKERAILLNNAPHRVRKMEFVIPCYSWFQQLYYGAGLKIYDLLSGPGGLGRSRMISTGEILDRLPTIEPHGLSGGVLYFDGQFDDAGLLIDIVSAANGHGASVLNYSPVRGLDKDGDDCVTGVEFENLLTGEILKPTARVVINASGAFCDSIRSMADASAVPLLRFSQGIHIVLERSFLPSDTAIMIPKTSDGRILFCISWLGHTLIGTTDTPIEKAELEPKALEDEIDFVLETAGRYLSRKPTRRDILSKFAGIRPLVNSDSARLTSSLSRGHVVEAGHGLVTITGGKWTTYRKMAEDAVNAAIRIGDLPPAACKTRDLLLTPLKGQSTVDDELLHPYLPYTSGDVLFAVRHQMAVTVEDVLARRTRALFLNARAAIESAEKVGGIIAETWAVQGYDLENDVSDFIEIARDYAVNRPA